MIPARISGSLVRGLVLGLFAFAIFGPIANMLLWTVAEVWYYPHKLPLEWGFSFWERVFRPQGNARVSLVNSVFIALLTVVASLMIAVPRGPRTRPGAPAVAEFLSAAVPVAAGVSVPCRAYEHRPDLLRFRPERNVCGGSPGPHNSGPCVLGLDIDGRIRRRRSRVGGSRPQSGCWHASCFPHHHTAAGTARHSCKRDIRIPDFAR